MASKPEEASDFLSLTLADAIGRKHSCGFDLLTYFAVISLLL